MSTFIAGLVGIAIANAIYVAAVVIRLRRKPRDVSADRAMFGPWSKP